MSEKLEEAVRYGLSYRSAYNEIRDNAQLAHMDASFLEEALFRMKDIMPVLVKDVRTSLRVLGNACQQTEGEFVW